MYSPRGLSDVNPPPSPPPSPYTTATTIGVFLCLFMEVANISLKVSDKRTDLTEGKTFPFPLRCVIYCDNGMLMYLILKSEKVLYGMSTT